MLSYKFVHWWGPGPSVDHDLLNHGTSLRLEDVTVKNYVIGCLLPFVAGHIGSSASLYLCKYALVIPCPVTSAVNSGVIGIFIFNLCSNLGKKVRHTAPFVVSVHCRCHSSSSSLFISLVIAEI